MEEEKNLFYGIIRADIMTIIGGVVFGKLSNLRKSAVEVIRVGLILSVICSLAITLNTFTIHNSTITVILTIFYSFVAVGTKSISIAMISEQRFSTSIIGTVIGVVSFIGFSPDAFFYNSMGKFFMHFDSLGYKMMFIVYMGVAAIGILCCNLMNKSKDN